MGEMMRRFVGFARKTKLTIFKKPMLVSNQEPFRSNAQPLPPSSRGCNSPTIPPPQSVQPVLPSSYWCIPPDSWENRYINPQKKWKEIQDVIDLIYRWIIIKGSWEAILPSYEWLLLDGIDYDEGWCASETWPWWRVVWDFTLHNNTSEKNWPWWRVVWDFTLHDHTSGKNWPWWRVV